MQSSSITTSLLVPMCAAGVLSIDKAFPVMLGANIGTTVTNILVSLAHISRGDEFQRAFAGSVVHDFFNICAVSVLLPLQISFNIIGTTAHALQNLFVNFGGLKFSSPLKLITKPVAEGIVDIVGDSAVLSAVVAIVLLFIALRYIVKVLKSLVLVRVERFFQRFIFRTPVLGLLFG
ncbi:MAG: hypothetical protein IH899_15415, partial [Planctomycetes bacterium]|nr:hypothetical protein [Planctomycetota bacterium]